MMRDSTNGWRDRRRGMTAVFVVITIPVLIGFAALTVDVGVIYGTRADLQNAADAAALAGASALTGDSMMQVRIANGESDAIYAVRASLSHSIHTVAAQNHSFGTDTTAVDPGDILLGWIDLTSGTAPLQTAVPANTMNAVQVTVRRSTEGTNSPVALMFASLFGKSFTSVTASAVAAFDDRFSGLETDTEFGGVMPLTMSLGDYEDQMEEADDDFSYDAATDSVSSGGDGFVEVIAFPGDSAPGSRGLLNIGVPNQSSSELAYQIENGVAPEDFEIEIGTSALTFVDADGAPSTYQITGNPGLKASLEGALLTRVGQVIAFFVHDSVSDSGSNTTYRIVGIRFGRIMEVHLKDSHANRGIWIQPTTYSGAGVITSVNAPSSGGVAGKLVLAR